MQTFEPALRVYCAVALFGALVAWSAIGCDDDPATTTGPGGNDTLRAPAAFIVNADGSGDFATIQDAIASAIDGDTIELGNGTFRGDGNRNIDYLGKKILVRSAAGEPDSCIIDVEGVPDAFEFGFHFRSGEDEESVLDGVTIVNGGGWGGAVLCDQSSPRLTRLVIRNQENYGINLNRSDVLIEQIRFEDVLDEALTIWSSNAIVRDCHFERNPGGALGSFFSTGVIERCTFINNGSDFAGAVHIGIAPDSGGTVTIRECVFERNTAARWGGAVLFGSAPSEMIDCLVIDNSAGEGGGGVAVGSRVEVTISGTTFVGNDAPVGSGLYSRYRGTVRVDRSIIAFGTGGAAVDADTTFGPVEIDVACSDIYGNAGGDWIGFVESMDGVDGNIEADPLFCSRVGEDFRLMPTSPCLLAPCGLMGALSAGCSRADRN